MMEVRFWSGSGLYIYLQLVILRQPGWYHLGWYRSRSRAKVNFLSDFQNI